MDFAAFKVLYEATFVPSRYTFYAYCTVPIFCFVTSIYFAPDVPFEVEEDNAGTGSDNEPPPRVFRTLPDSRTNTHARANTHKVYRTSVAFINRHARAHAHVRTHTQPCLTYAPQRRR